MWRKKIKKAAESDGKHSGAVLEDAAPGAGQDGVAGGADILGVVAAAGSQAGLTPQNQDASPGIWPADTREFCLPVSHSASRRPYVIPRNYRISASLSTARQVVVHGEFAVGMLEAPTVTVVPTGVVRGRVVANNLQIAGTVDANVHAKLGIEVSGRGRLAGDVRAPAVKVWPGAVLHASKLTVGC